MRLRWPECSRLWREVNFGVSCPRKPGSASCGRDHYIGTRSLRGRPSYIYLIQCREKAVGSDGALALQIPAQHTDVANVAAPHGVKHVADERDRADHAIERDIADHAGDQMPRRAEPARFDNDIGRDGG